MLIYEHVTRNVNSTDLTVNNARIYPRGPGIYLSQSIKFIPAGCAVVYHVMAEIYERELRNQRAAIFVRVRPTYIFFLSH